MLYAVRQKDTPDGNLKLCIYMSRRSSSFRGTSLPSSADWQKCSTVIHSTLQYILKQEDGFYLHSRSLYYRQGSPDRCWKFLLINFYFCQGVCNKTIACLLHDKTQAFRYLWMDITWDSSSFHLDIYVTWRGSVYADPRYCQWCKQNHDCFVVYIMRGLDWLLLNKLLRVWSIQIHTQTQKCHFCWCVTRQLV